MVESDKKSVKESTESADHPQEEPADRPESVPPKPITGIHEARWLGALTLGIFGPYLLVAGLDAEEHKIFYFAAGVALLARFALWLASSELCFRFADLAFVSILWVATSSIGPSVDSGDALVWIDRVALAALAFVAVARALFWRTWNRSMPTWENILLAVLLGIIFLVPNTATWPLGRGLLVVLVLLDFSQRAELNMLLQS